MDLEEMDVVDGVESNGNGGRNGRATSEDFVVYDHRNQNNNGSRNSPNRHNVETYDDQDEDETTDIVVAPVLRQNPHVPSPSVSPGSGSESQDSRKIWDFVKRKFKTRGSDFGAPLASCNPYDFEYNMNHPLRGKAIIFNHTTYDPRLKSEDRPGSDKDAADLRDTLERLHFKVEIYNDLTRSKMHSVLERESLENHNNEDCIVIIVMTHGTENGLFAFDDAYKPEELWHPFTADKCGSLAGKPKMFFIQACRGDKYDHGTMLMKPKSRTEIDGPSNTKAYKIPNHADFLVVFSTAPGYFSWRSSVRGGCFTQALCRVLDQYAWDLDILSMITLVNREVAINYESNVPRDLTQHQMKQVPHVTHTLTRQIRLSPKSLTRTGASTLV